MPYENGKIFIDTSTTPPRGITIADLKKCFGIGTYDDIGGVVKAAIDGRKVNIFAKYKAIQSPSIKPVTEDDRVGAGYGLEDNKEYLLVDTNDIKEAFNNAFNGIYSWVYPPPDLLIGHKFRFQDWNGYNHNAKCPIYFADSSYTGNANVNIGQYYELPENNITLYDLRNILSNDWDSENLSYGLLYKKVGTTNIVLIGEGVKADGSPSGTGKYPLYDTDGNALSYNIELGDEGAYQCVPIIIAFNRGYFAVLPITPITTIKVTKPYIQPLRINATVNTGSKYTISLSITAGEAGCNSGTISLYFFKEHPAKGEDWDNVFYEKLDYTYNAANAGVTQVILDAEKFDISPSDAPILYITTNDTMAGVTVTQKFPAD